MPKKMRITKKMKKRNKIYDSISLLLSLLVFLYVFIIEFMDYQTAFIYIPIEILFITLIVADYFIYKKSKFNIINVICLMVNAVVLAYILCIEIVLLPLTFKNPNSAYIYKLVYTYLISHETVLVPILIIIGGTFIFPGFRALLTRDKRPIYSLFLTVGISILAFGLFFSRVCIIISSYM